MDDGFSHKGNISFSFAELDQSSNPDQGRRGLLPDREHIAEIVLGLLQRGFFRLLGCLILCQQVFDLSCGSIVVNGLLQRRDRRVGCSLLVATHAAAASAASAASAEHPAHSTGIEGLLGVHHFLNERLDRAPVGVIGDVKRILVALHHELLAVEIAATTTAATAESTAATAASATATTATATAKAAAAATTEPAATTATTAKALREDAAGAQHQSCRHSADG